MIRIMVILLVGLFIMNSILIQGIAAMVEDLHQLHFGVPKNVPEEEDERRVEDLSCRELAETEQEYELCRKLQKGQTPFKGEDYYLEDPLRQAPDDKIVRRMG